MSPLFFPVIEGPRHDVRQLWNVSVGDFVEREIRVWHFKLPLRWVTFTCFVYEEVGDYPLLIFLALPPLFLYFVR